ncbi:MAG TPA: hypothetical protein VFQ22_02200, partial [Longimicrobiales bacterium]|nr:hypothetical protein [Longimicrobiales bacterium]
MQLAGNPPWELTSTIPLPLGFSELIAAGLIRRADVQYVERRRFAAAVSRERSGVERPAGAPPAGVSPGVELLASIVWVAIPGAEASLEVRLADAETGATVSAGRTSLPPDADPVGVARQAVAQILARLAEIGRLPAWTDPLPDAAPAAYRPSGVGREQ